jgi:hypothetical protein
MKNFSPQLPSTKVPTSHIASTEGVEVLPVRISVTTWQ